MSLNKLGVIFASLVLAASAVLPPLPPHTVIPDDLRKSYAAEGHEIEDFQLDLGNRSVALNCPGCAFATQEEAGLRGRRTKATLSFSTCKLVATKTRPCKPKPAISCFLQASTTANHLYVTQVDPDNDEPLHLLVTSYTFRFNGAREGLEPGMEFLPMNLQIAAVEGIAVELPLLDIEVIKDAGGSLYIASISAVDTSATTLPAKEENCNEWPLLCKWKGIVAERIEKMKKMGKGCNKRPHGHYNPMMEEVWQGKPPHRFRPGRPHHRPHHMGHGHHSQHRIHTFARRAFITVFIPIIVGIFAGTVTYLLGMVLGTIIAIIIAKVRGQGYQRIALEEDVEEGEAEVETEAQSEKQEYAELPAYDAPPVYEEADEKVNESK